MLAGVTNGFNYAALNVVAIRAEWPSSDQTIGLISTGTLIGATVASLIAGPIADRAGRRVAATVGEIVLLCGVFTAAVAPSARWLAVFEFVKGMGCGICTTTKCLIVSEMSPPEWRGRVMTAWGLAFTIGGSIPASLNALMNWRAQLLCGAPTAVAMLCLLSFTRVTNVPEPTSEGIQYDAETQVTETTILHRQRPAVYTTELIVGIGVSIPVAAVATLPGSTPFGSDFGLTLGTLGISTARDPAQFLAITTVFSVVGTVAALVSMTLIDRIGRVALLIRGGAASVLVGGLLGAYGLFFLSDDTDAHGSGSGSDVIIPLLLLCFWLLVSKCGPTTVFLVIIAELFPTPVRGLGVGSCVFAQHLIQIAISFLYPLGLSRFGLGTLSAGCALAVVLPLVVCHKLVTEERFPQLRAGAPLTS